MHICSLAQVFPAFLVGVCSLGAIGCSGGEPGPSDAGRVSDASAGDAGSSLDAGPDPDRDAGSGSYRDGGLLVPAGPRRMFTTSVKFPADRALDACSIVAAAAELPGEWVPWLSTSDTDAIDRVVGDGPWLDTGDGRELFGNRAQLQTVPNEEIEYDEHGDHLFPLSGHTQVWTGTNVGGGHSGASCGGWTTNDPSQTGTIGSYAWTDHYWTAYDEPFSCDQVAHVYCIQR